MKTILFQGDSITDAGRNREERTHMGTGYPYFVSVRMGVKYPGEYEFLNRGISGDRIVDVYARMKCDIINLKPDYMSLLIGVNDVWHELDYENGVSAPKFKKVYRLMLEELQEELPDMKIILLEPFVQKGTGTEAAYDWFRREVELRAQAVRELADEFGLPFMPLQADLDALLEKAPSEYWLQDGVHPTDYFHQYMADKWVETFESIRKADCM